jgi:hypothetical protein
MEAVMKSIIPAALVVILEFGFIASIAALPTPPVPLQAELQVASRQAPAKAPAVTPGTRS